jgi:hypothetical protein
LTHIENRYQHASEYSTEEGVAELLKLLEVAKEAVVSQEVKVEESEEAIRRLQADQAARNSQCIATAKSLSEAEVVLFDRLIDLSDGDAAALAREHENKRLVANAATGAYQRLVSVRMPQAVLVKLAVQLAHQEAVADVADAYASYTLARKLMLLAPLLAVEGNLTVQGGLSELAHVDAINERARCAEISQALREKQARFDSSQQ